MVKLIAPIPSRSNEAEPRFCAAMTGASQPEAGRPLRSRTTGETNRAETRPAAGAGSTETAAPPGIATVSGIAASARLLELAHGLYGLSFGETKGKRGELAGLAMPSTHITGVPVDGLAAVEVFAASVGAAGWLGPEGGTVAVKIPSDRGRVLITTYRLADQEAAPLDIQIVRIDRPLPPPTPGFASTAEISPPGSEQSAEHTVKDPARGDVNLEIVLHIERIGDRRFVGGEWVGSRGQGRPIQAFSVRPLEKLAATDIEYKAYGPGGRETPWVTAAALCGTRGQGIALTGFAIRLLAQPSERFEVVYQGAFAESGVTEPRRNGEPCAPSSVDDALEAMHIRVIERAV
jgi:hypothetical protein